MNVIVVGCGKAGRAVVESMVDENHNVMAIDNDPAVIEELTNTYDVMAVCGNATARELLVEAGVAKADLFVAITDRDEVNMLSCFLAKKLGAKYTVARIRQSDYNEDGLDFLCKQLDLSMSVNPEFLTAESIYNTLRLPSAVVVDTFAGKKIHILEMIVREKSDLLCGTLADLRKKSPVQFLACSVLRKNELIIPRGEFAFQVGDKVAFMVKSSDTYRFLKTIGMAQKQGRFVILLGASETAYYLTKMLCSAGYSVKIIEKDPVRCSEMAAKLPAGATMILGDGSSQELLQEEGIAVADAFVALTGKDEENILISFYARSEHVQKVVCKVSHGQLSLLAENLGLDCLISSTKSIADVLTRYARALNDSMQSKVETMYRLMDGNVEALEFVVLGDCTFVGVPLKQLHIKPDYIIAGIIRGKETLIPSGDDCIYEGDRVVVIAAGQHLYDLSDIVR